MGKDVVTGGGKAGSYPPQCSNGQVITPLNNPRGLDNWEGVVKIKPPPNIEKGDVKQDASHISEFLGKMVKPLWKLFGKF